MIPNLDVNGPWGERIKQWGQFGLPLALLLASWPNSIKTIHSWYHSSCNKDRIPIIFEKLKFLVIFPFQLIWLPFKRPFAGWCALWSKGAHTLMWWHNGFCDTKLYCTSWISFLIFLLSHVFPPNIFNNHRATACTRKFLSHFLPFFVRQVK